MTRAAYLVGKFASNLMVLASMTGVLAVAALVLQLARGESRHIDLVALLAPFVALTLPVLTMTAAAAVLFETLPALRGGLGNIAWFFVWMSTAIAGGGVPLGGLNAVATSMRQAMAAQHTPDAGEFSIGFTQVDQPLSTFAWDATPFTGALLGQRLVLIAAAVCLVLLPVAWFDRFDRSSTDPGTAAVDCATAVPSAVRPAELSRLVRWQARPPAPATASRAWFGRLLVGEVRILVRATPRWWWLVAAVIGLGGLLIPTNLDHSESASALVLAAAWLWPVLLWSRLGTQRRDNGVEGLLSACPATYRQMAAEWAAGVMVAVLTGLGPVARMAVNADAPRTAAWVGGAVFIPSLALLLGVATRSPRPFQVLYLALWYATVNQVTAVDVMGAILIDGRPAGPSPLIVVAAALLVLAAAFAVRAARHATR